MYMNALYLIMALSERCIYAEANQKDCYFNNYSFYAVQFICKKLYCS